MATNKQRSESKGDRFKRLAERRATETIAKLRLVGNLSDKKNYDYTDDQVRQIFDALESELRACKARFKSADTTIAPKFIFKK
jgi:hypothetical protein